MKMCELLVAASAALIISGNENYGIAAFVLSMIGLLFRTSLELHAKTKDQEKQNQEIAKNISEDLLKEAKAILQKNFNNTVVSNKNFN